MKTYAYTENYDKRSRLVAGMEKEWLSYFMVIIFVA